MILGVPREIKDDEYRIAMLPVGVDLLTNAGHKVIVEKGAGLGSGYEDEQYTAAGATIETNAEAIFENAQIIVKVKEPIGPEHELMRPGQVLFTYFHLAAARDVTEACLNREVTAMAYETLTDAKGQLPLLTPMSEVAGRMSIQEGAKYLEKPMMGRGILLGGVTGVEPGNVLILGAGVVGTNAARMAAGLGANVVIMDIDIDRLRFLDAVMPANVHTAYSHPHAVADHAIAADLVVGAVLIPGGRTPVLIAADMLKHMKNGSVIVDVGVDQGGCVETIRPTTHHDPTYIVDGVVHYGVTNMPGAVGRTSTQALCHATQPYVIQLADRLDNENVKTLVADSPAFASAMNTYDGMLTNKPVAEALDMQDRLKDG